MRNRIIFLLAAVGIVLGLVSATIYARQPKPQPPVFNPASNPYARGIYANGIIESDQSHGANINIYPEVSGPITEILVQEGDRVRRGEPMLRIDDRVQRATAEQQRAQAEAAQALLEELKAQPRSETLAVAAAQVANARATLKNARDQLEKQERAYRIEPRSVSKDALDNARNAAAIAATNLSVVEKQYALTKAGAWIYDVRNQERQAEALSKAYAASAALLEKFTIAAPVDGVVLAIQAATGSYVSSQGAYNSYTQGFNPLIVMGTPQDTMEVRVYVDEILLHRLPDPAKMEAQMVVRGTDIRLPLSFARMQPYVSPKIELSDQRLERVDLRVLPLIFRFKTPKDVALYPGELVDVYIASR